MLLLALLACHDDLPFVQDTSDSLTSPTFTEIAVTCDASAGRWSFQATTQGWTGGGEIWLSADGRYVEQHPWASTGAWPDQAADALQANLSVASDPRDVSPGSLTLFNCGRPDIQGVLRIFNRDRSAQADCRRFGAASDIWATWAPDLSCPETLEGAEGEDSGDSGA